MKIYLACLAALLFFNINLSAQDLANSGTTQPSGTASMAKVPDELKNKVGDFFKKLIKDETAQAYNELLKGSLILKNKDQIDNLVEQTKKSSEVYGHIRSFEQVSTEFLTPSMVRMKYLGLHAEMPMRWLFIFYKSPENGWIVLNVKFDDNAESYFIDF